MQNTCFAVMFFVAALGLCLNGLADDASKPTGYEKVLLDKNIQPTAEGLTHYLDQLHPTTEQQQRVRALIQQLGSVESFSAREAAMKALLVMPTLPTEMLVNATKGGDPEIRWRAATVLEAGKPEAARVLYAAFRVIEKKKLSATVPAMLRAIPLCDKRHILSACQTALESAAAAENIEVLRQATRSADGNVRALATAALGKAAGKEADADFERLISDGSNQVRLEAARAMANYGKRRAVDDLVHLLKSKAIPVRSSAVVALRELTGQHFAFAAYDTSQRREAAIEKWTKWAAADGRTAELTFPLTGRFQGSYLGGNTLLAYGYKNKVVEFDPSGKEVWSFTKSNGAWSAEKMANGNVLIACNQQSRVIEVDPRGEIVWEMSVPNALNAKPLQNGNYLIAQHNGGLAIEVTPEKETVWKYKTQGNCSDIHRLDNGNTLCGAYQGPVVEVTPDGKVVWEYGPVASYGIQPLPNGNVLIAEITGRVIEVDRNKEIVWEHREQNAVDAFRLENGNTLITGHQRWVEVSPDKKVVWEKKGCQYGSARR